jgi:hypothetical protein
MRRAQVFNLSEAELRRGVLEPWTRGTPVQLGDREWDPAESELKILEGPELDTQQLAFGQGWSNALRKSRDVTRELLAATPPSVVVMVDTPEARAAVTPLLERLGLRQEDWSVARTRVLDSAGPPGAQAAVIVLDGAPTPERWFEVGLAVGALGGRAILTALGAATLPGDFTQQAVIRLDATEPNPAQALGERLRQLGLTRP